jgi:hypothetical protein
MNTRKGGKEVLPSRFEFDKVAKQSGMTSRDIVCAADNQPRSSSPRCYLLATPAQMADSECSWTDKSKMDDDEAFLRCGKTAKWWLYLRAICNAICSCYCAYNTPPNYLALSQFSHSILSTLFSGLWKFSVEISLEDFRTVVVLFDHSGIIRRKCNHSIGKYVKIITDLFVCLIKTSDINFKTVSLQVWLFIQ